MLYDNALLVRAYLHAWQVTKEPAFKQIVGDTLNFIIREMTHEQGGFYSSLDADSEGEEGSFYVWTLDEIRETLKDDSDFLKRLMESPQKGISKERQFSNAHWMMLPSPPTSNLTLKLFLLNWQNLIPNFYRSAPCAFAPTQMTKSSPRGTDLCWRRLQNKQEFLRT
jgi:hypothetical protein